MNTDWNRDEWGDIYKITFTSSASASYKPKSPPGSSSAASTEPNPMAPLTDPLRALKETEETEQCVGQIEKKGKLLKTWL